MTTKKLTPKNMANMFKEFHSAWKSREDDYNKHIGKSKKKKK